MQGESSRGSRRHKKIILKNYKDPFQSQSIGGIDQSKAVDDTFYREQSFKMVNSSSIGND
jgi:hypothetical protein